ncbi:rhamnogalacturonase A precursor [Xylariaceae sp. FL1272]|nr:rhamnogalacturonase A precursor [Xylariaceae sp. FL1272]
MLTSILSLGLLLLVLPALAQLTKSVGPLLTATHKADVLVCDIEDYGATEDDDIASALADAENAFADVGGLVYIGPGNWPLATALAFEDVTSIAIQLDGTIYRDGLDGESQLLFKEEYGPRLLRFKLENFSIPGIALVDSPAYYLDLVEVSQGEVYNIIIRGSTTLVATDGIDVTNGDEYVTVKSPSSNLLIQSIYCNRSGGTASGPWINHGSGYVTGVSWTDVIIHGSSYPLAVNMAWGDDVGGDGVVIADLEWSTYGEVCTNVYGEGSCLTNETDDDDPDLYTSTITSSATSTIPKASTMAADLAADITPSTTLTIPSIPTSFFPVQTPTSTLLSFSVPVTYGAT